MKLQVLRRKIKSRVQSSAGKTQEKIPLLLASLSLMVFVLLVFCVVQLTVVSMLSPRGSVLREYNQEKTALLEENRILEQRIAERAALGVVDNRAQKELSMDRVDEVFYLNAESVAAEASAQ